MAISLEGEPEPRVIVGTEYTERMARLSPDGRWLAYESDVAGQYEIWVRGYPGPSAPVRVSQNGGILPVWSRDQRELFYIEGTLGAGNTRLMGISVETTPEFDFGSPEVVLDGGFTTWTNAPGVYDVSLDSQRFLMIRGESTSDSPFQINIVLNWFEELKERVPVN